MYLPAAPLPGTGTAGASAAACAARQAERRCCALCCCAGSRGMRHACFLAGLRVHSQAELVCGGNTLTCVRQFYFHYVQPGITTSTRQAAQLCSYLKAMTAHSQARQGRMVYSQARRSKALIYESNEAPELVHHTQISLGQCAAPVLDAFGFAARAPPEHLPARALPECLGTLFPRTGSDALQDSKAQRRVYVAWGAARAPAHAPLLACSGRCRA